MRKPQPYRCRACRKDCNRYRRRHGVLDHAANPRDGPTDGTRCTATAHSGDGRSSGHGAGGHRAGDRTRRRDRLRSRPQRTVVRGSAERSHHLHDRATGARRRRTDRHRDTGSPRCSSRPGHRPAARLMDVPRQRSPDRGRAVIVGLLAVAVVAGYGPLKRAGVDLLELGGARRSRLATSNPGAVERPDGARRRALHARFRSRWELEVPKRVPGVGLRGLCHRPGLW